MNKQFLDMHEEYSCIIKRFITWERFTIIRPMHLIVFLYFIELIGLIALAVNDILTYPIAICMLISFFFINIYITGQYTYFIQNYLFNVSQKQTQFSEKYDTYIFDALKNKNISLKDNHLIFNKNNLPKEKYLNVFLQQGMIKREYENENEAHFTISKYVSSPITIDEIQDWNIDMSLFLFLICEE